MVEYFRTDAHRFFQGFRANRLNHEFLNVDVVVSVLAAVDDVHHRQWHGEFAGVPFSSAMCSYSGMPLEAAAAFAAAGNRQNGVGAEVGFVLGAVQIDHDLVDVRPVFGIFTQYCLSNRTVYCSNGFQYAFTQKRDLSPSRSSSFAGTGRST